MEITIVRRDHARGTNLADKDQPVVLVKVSSYRAILLTSASILCTKDGPVPATEATDEQIIHAIQNDESVY